jgi:xylulokinase
VEPVVAGVDSSTQSCKVELRQAHSGAVLGSGTAPHPRTSPPVSEQNPTDWWQALRLALGRALDDARVQSSQIVALSVAAQCHGLVLLGEDNQVLRPAKLWNDLTSAPQAEAMVAELGPSAWAEAVGSVPTAAFTLTKLAWVAEREPHLLRQATGACLPHDWLTLRLTGRLVTDRSEASGTGYYSPRQGVWRRDLLQRFAQVPGDFRLPQVLGPDTAAGSISPAAAAELGLSGEVLIGPGAGDQHAAALGMGIAAGDVVFSLGTSGVVMTVSEQSVHDPTGAVNGVCDATGRYLPLVCSLNATRVTDWFRQLLGVDHAQFDALATAVPPAERTVTLAAFFDGERTPNLPRARGLLAGLTPDTTPAQLARAAVDGVVLGLVEGLDAITACGVATAGQVVVAGGGAASLAYRQSIADLVGRPVHVLEAPGATVRGACLQAATIWAGASIDQVRDAWRPPVALTTHPGSTPPPQLRQSYRTLAGFRGADRTEP